MLILLIIIVKTLMTQVTKMEMEKKKMILMVHAMDALLASDRLSQLRIFLSNFTPKFKISVFSL